MCLQPVWDGWLVVLVFTALQHFSGHFGRVQLTYPHCSWASHPGNLPVLSAHSFASNWQLPFLNQRKGENGRRNYFMTNLHERTLPDVRIEPATVRMPGRRASDRATAPGSMGWCFTRGVFLYIGLSSFSLPSLWKTTRHDCSAVDCATKPKIKLIMCKL